MNEPLLLILDGNNLLMRAAFGHRHLDSNGEWTTLKTSDGRETGGLYGTVKTFITLVRRFSPTHVLWTFDWGKSEYRTALQPEYKANRKKEGSEKVDLSAQYSAFDHFLSLVGVYGYRHLNVEADDIMALAVKEWEDRLPILLVSGDHDLRQLVAPRVGVLKPSMGTGRNVKENLYTLDKVREEYGLDPERLPELWALTGDSGDNISGVTRVGEITAKKIIDKHGDLWTALENEPKLKGWEHKVNQNYSMIKLPAPGLNLPMSLADLEFDRDGYNPKDLESFFVEYEFNSLLREMETEGGLWRE